MSESSSVESYWLVGASETRGPRSRNGTPLKLSMVRIFRHYVPMQLVLLALLEGGLFFGSIYLGAAVRFNFAAIDSVAPIWPKGLVFAAIMLLCMTAFGLYNRETPKGNFAYYAKFVGSFLIGLVAMTALFYLAPDLFIGRGAFGIAFVAAFGSVVLVRLLFFRVADQQALQRRVLVLGTGLHAAAVGKLLRDNPSGHKFRLVGYLPLESSDRYVDHGQILTDKGSLLSIVNRYAVDEVVVGVRDRRNGGIPMSDLLQCKMEGVKVSDLTTFFERETGHVQIESLNPSWIVFSDGFHHASHKYIIKRMFDIVVSLLLLAISLPIMALTAVFVVVESGFPVFYRQVRVGELGRTFKMLKFRSMRRDAERDGTPQWAKKDDDRVTRVGRVIRKVRIDELPQIFNVLKGDMSFVGPRPERPYFVCELAKQIPYYLNRHAVKPGITGWAQISYPYGASVEDAVRKLQYDLYYTKNQSLFLDLIVLFQTAQVILFGQGAR